MRTIDLRLWCEGNTTIGWNSFQEVVVMLEIGIWKVSMDQNGHMALVVSAGKLLKKRDGSLILF